MTQTKQSNGLTLVTEKGNEMAAITPENFAKQVGELLRENTEKITFKFYGSTITVPSVKSTDQVQRFHKLVKGLSETICSKVEKDQDIKNPEHIAIVEALKKTGFRFEGLNRVAIEEGIRIRIAAKSAVINLRKVETRDLKENKVYLNVTNTARVLNKLIVTEGRGAAIAKLAELKKDGKDGGLMLLSDNVQTLPKAKKTRKKKVIAPVIETAATLETKQS
jgi:hypothetical protein